MQANMVETETPRAKIQAAMQTLGLVVSAKFVPFSQSRNKGEKNPSLNWIVTLARNGREILSTDYMAGSGHAPANKCQDKPAKHWMVAWECEHGGTAIGCRWGRDPEAYGTKPGSLKPDACDVIHSLVLDSEVLDYATFESWASDFGYDADSRKAEKIYQACLAIALPLRNGIGEAGLAMLREAGQDY